jgi:ketosteroid isomerase-like protein
MSQENAESIRAVYEGSARATFAPARNCSIRTSSAYSRDLLAGWEDFTRGVRPGFPKRDPFRGRSGLEAKEIVAAGDSVLVDVSQRGLGRTSGAPAEMRYFTLWSFRGGTVIRIESFRERPDALKAAGLSE